MKASMKINTSEFSELSFNKFVSRFGEIIQAVISNLVIFENFPYTAAELNLRLQAITDKTNFAVDGSKASKNERDIEHAACIVMLENMTVAVAMRANQEPTAEQQIAIIELAHFIPYKSRAPIGTLPAPSNLSAKNTRNTGEICLRWKNQKGVRAWIIQHVAGTDVSPTAKWQYFSSSVQVKFTATGLTTGYHSFRIVSISTSGESQPSEPVTEYAK